jgi:hypothetical protein
VNYVGTIQVSVEDVDLNLCDSHKNKRGRLFYQIAFTAIITLGSDEGVMQVTVLWNGNECGSGKLKFSDEDSKSPDPNGASLPINSRLYDYRGVQMDERLGFD